MPAAKIIALVDMTSPFASKHKGWRQRSEKIEID
jgi:hypothetical protein